MGRVGLVMGLLAGTLTFAPQAALARDLDVSAGGQEISVDAVADNIVRIRVWPKGHEPRDESWAVDRAIRDGRADAQVDGDSLATHAIKVTVDPATLAVKRARFRGQSDRFRPRFGGP